MLSCRQEWRDLMTIAKPLGEISKSIPAAALRGDFGAAGASIFCYLGTDVCGTLDFGLKSSPYRLPRCGRLVLERAVFCLPAHRLS